MLNDGFYVIINQIFRNFEINRSAFFSIKSRDGDTFRSTIFRKVSSWNRIDLLTPCRSELNSCFQNQNRCDKMEYVVSLLIYQKQFIIVYVSLR